LLLAEQVVQKFPVFMGVRQLVKEIGDDKNQATKARGAT